MKRLLAILIVNCAVLRIFCGGLEGLSGVELAQALAREFAPIDVAVDFKPAVWFDKGKMPVWLAPAEWWGDGAPCDHYNIVGGSAEFNYTRSDYPPGELLEITDFGSGWNVGIGEIAGVKTNLWQPSDDRRGDLARRLMYMAVMYPNELWRGRAAMLFADGNFPLLTEYGKRLLLDWHRVDSVSEQERNECREISIAQGNINPFVEYPELAEYLWGMHAGEGYIEPENRNRIPLKPVYSLAKDEYIDLYSPYISVDSQWQINGHTINDERIATTELGVGTHELFFSNSTARGSLKIIIRQ